MTATLWQGAVLSYGKCAARHWAMAALARRAGCCGLQPKRRRMRPAWVGSSDTPNSRRLARATRWQAGCPHQTRRRWSLTPAVRAAGGAKPGRHQHGPCFPLAHRAFGDAQGFGDVLLLPAFSEQFPSAAARFLPNGIGCRSCRRCPSAQAQPRASHPTLLSMQAAEQAGAFRQFGATSDCSCP